MITKFIIFDFKRKVQKKKILRRVYPSTKFFIEVKKIVKKKFFGGRGDFFFFLGAISLGRVVVPSPKIVINLPGTYEKLPC